GDGEPWWIADGGSDVAVARRILLAFAEGESFREGDVEWRFEAEEGVDLSALPHASPQPAGAEQSNTSLRCGDFAMLKFYRKLEAGAHPEVEMMRYLTRVARFPHTPALLGVGEVDDSHGGSEVSSMLQALVPGARDAWELGLERGTALLGAAGEGDPPNRCAKEMRELGRNTRAMHEALAGAMEDPALMPADADVEDVTQWTRRARSLQLDALDLLAQRREAGGVPGLSAAAAAAVLRRRSELVAARDDGPSGGQGNAGPRSRHRGHARPRPGPPPRRGRGRGRR